MTSAKNDNSVFLIQTFFFEKMATLLVNSGCHLYSMTVNPTSLQCQHERLLW